ncbi:MAP kinase kinase kinase mkh1 [Cyphellophora attinorum]|uniref:Mitogen-activated protein kinase kinae kinase bck1 n=1 Tax=Cyphellophora attinorum TaxID=1664694 RepID=A0A0N1P102_9EURO|nr:MAP kinase kinase kinase mkh1 [Phialophora attinorum]KPI44380.1 MAP kinase kinase kinase mkh1 [Phialophora attinorum]
MDNQHQPYIPPPPPLGQQNSGNTLHLPPPPPRSYPQQNASNLPPPPPGPHPSSLPPGTVYGVPNSFQNNWARAGTLPPPPPLNQNASYNANRQQAMNVPPPPPQQQRQYSQSDQPFVSATFIPTGGGSFGPGVGIPSFDDFSTFAYYDVPMTTEPSTRKPTEQRYSDGTYNPHSYSYPNPAQPNPDIANRENRAASASSKMPPAYPSAKRDFSEPVSPGPPTATLINPQIENAKDNATRARAQSATTGSSVSSALAAQWPIEKVLQWLAANNFSPDWQEAFRQLKMDGVDFLDLGKAANGRGNLGMMHSRVYPRLARVCSESKTGWDQSREREEGKRLRKLISRIGDDGPPSAGSGHRRRESGLISASTEGTVEDSPHLSQSDFAQPGSATSFGPRGSQGRSSTLPVMPRAPSSTSTPVDGRGDYTRGILSNVGVGRGRHSPQMSGDASNNGLPAPKFEASPSSSPGLGQAVPAKGPGDPQRPQHAKTLSTDSTAKNNRSALGFTGPSMSDTQIPTERFYEQQTRRDGHDMPRPGMLDTSRTYSNEQVPVSAKEGGKGFLSKFMRKNRHERDQDVDHPLESPTSPGLRSIFSKPAANNSDSALAQRPLSTAASESAVPTLRERRPTWAARKYIFVTPDNWNYRLIDVTMVTSAESLKKLICEELAVSLGDTVTFHLTEPGQTDHDYACSDEILMSAHSRSDSTANVRIFVATPNFPASPNRANGLGMSFSQRNQGGTAMLKSASATGAHTYNRTPSPDSLRRAQEEYRKQTEAKQRAYLQSRLERKEQSKTNVHDFDSPRASPFEEKKTDSFVPVRRAPTAPSESSTLTKVNSLRMARGGSGTRNSLEALKRNRDSIVEEDARNKDGRSSPGIGAALAGMGRMAGSPGMFKGEEDVGPGFAPKFRLQPAPRRQNTYGQSPDISPATENFQRPALHSRKSYGPDFEFQETNVTFANSPHPPPQVTDDGSDDSDDGLFAIPLTNKSLPAGEKPTLKLDTDQTHAPKPKVAFRTPQSSGGVSLGRNSADGNGSAGEERSYSDGSFSESASASASAYSPGGGLGRRNSFLHSDIWASRPTVENVVENLDEFFPGVDLDKPFMEEAGKGQTPVETTPSLRTRVTFGSDDLNIDFSKQRRNESDTLGSDESTLKARDQQTVTSIAQRQLGKSGGLGRMKSIREVAQRRNVDGVQRASSIARPGPAVEPVAAQASGLQRRKSTKLWGANIQMIKPKAGARLSTLDPIPQEDVPKEDQPPKRSTTFKILRGQLIGKGTYGRVYLGMNATTGDFLAVKQVEVNQKVSGGDKDRIKEMVAALDIEIETMKDLEHPNIVQYLGCDRREFSISIYLEYISGGSVGSCLRKHGKFEESVVRSLTRQTLEGLAYLHEEGILHRDLKADNILLDTDGTCKITDFGISKKSDNIYGNDVTNSMQGSVFWMAPEVVRSQGQGYSAKIDIWSLGCVVLEMFAGKRPWSREEAIGAIFKLGNLNQAPPIPDDVRDSASTEGLNFMFNCFEIIPEDRPTAATLLNNSDFCIPDPHYDFMNTELAAKLRSAVLGKRYIIDGILQQRSAAGRLWCVYRAKLEGKNFILKDILPGDFDDITQLQKLVEHSPHVRTAVDSIPARQIFVFPYLKHVLHHVRTIALDQPARKAIIRDALTGLADLHDQNILHTDIKPTNVVMNAFTRPDGKPGCCDVQITDLEGAVVLPPNAKGLGHLLSGNKFWRSPRPGPEAIFVWTGRMIFTPKDAIHASPKHLGEDDQILHRHLSYFAADTKDFEGFAASYGGDDNPCVLRFKQLLCYFNEIQPRYPFVGWQQVDAQFRDLVCRMTYMDPSRRITAREALGHPWLKAA